MFVKAGVVRAARVGRTASRQPRTDGVALILTPPARSPVDRQRIVKRADRSVHAEKGLVRGCDAMKLNSGRVRVMDAREQSAARQLRSTLTAFVYRTLRHVDQRPRDGPVACSHLGGMRADGAPSSTEPDWRRTSAPVSWQRPAGFSRPGQRCRGPRGSEVPALWVDQSAAIEEPRLGSAPSVVDCPSALSLSQLSVAGLAEVWSR